jgi:hypothetical protein
LYTLLAVQGWHWFQDIVTWWIVNA